MNSSRKAGRPPREAVPLSRQRILEVALPLLREAGPDAISFRKLGEHLDVTPMAIKYHVGSQREMLASLVSLAFAATLETSYSDDPVIRLRDILRSYCTRALQNTRLVQCVHQDPSLMSDELVSITTEIRKNTQLLNDGDHKDELLNLLVDYTHGFVFAAAACRQENQPTETDFLRSLDWILIRTAIDNNKQRLRSVS